jgi:hypothetical protein
MMFLFMKLTKLVLYFSVFSMIFWRILQDLCFYKEKNERKGKRLARAWSNPQRSRPNYKDSVHVEKEAH